MGQKTHPYGFRLGVTKPWHSRWFAKRDYSRLLHEDLKLKRDLKKQLHHAGVASIEVERMANKLRITIFTSRPGIIIGRKGAEIDKLKVDIQKRTNREVYINIQEIHRPELDAQLVAESIAMQLEKRIAFRRAMRKSVDSALRFGAKGIKVRVSGRLNGAEIARFRVVSAGDVFLCIRFARTSITVSRRPIRPTALLESSAGFIKVKFCRIAVLRGQRQREFEGSELC
jgi:small subunit ribosomal protein S3